MATMTLDDLQAVADLTAEALRIKPPEVTVGRGKQSFAYPTARQIRLAHWCSRVKGLWEEVAIAEVVHEVCHFSAPDNEPVHGRGFRRNEIESLALWGLVPKDYARSYWRTLETTDGRVLWDAASRIALIVDTV